jgi:hypothetical protein
MEVLSFMVAPTRSGAKYNGVLLVVRNGNVLYKYPMDIFDEPSRKVLPKAPDLDEIRYRALKGVASLIPGGGELFGLLTSPLARRRDDWMEDLERRLRDLEGHVKGFRFDDLGQDDQFVSATLQATQAALKTHQEEKLEALRNAVLNVASGKETDPDRQTVFIDLVARFTPFHLALLRFFQNPQGYCDSKEVISPPDRDNQPIFLLLHDCMPNLVAQTKSPTNLREAAGTQFLDIVVMDLAGAALITPDLKNVYQKPPRYQRWTTHLGDDFLDFITLSPIGEK